MYSWPGKEAVLGGSHLQLHSGIILTFFLRWWEMGIGVLYKVTRVARADHLTFPDILCFLRLRVCACASIFFFLFFLLKFNPASLFFFSNEKNANRKEQMY